jgi:Spy/CpxP family protein refolding chaperone
MKTRLTILLSACLLLLSIALQAQTTTPPAPPAGGPPSFANILKAAQSLLNLTDQQVQQFTDLHNSFQTTTQNLRTQLRGLNEQIITLSRSSNPDATQLANLIVQRQDLQQQLKTAATNYQNSAAALLTPAQKAQVAQIQEALKLVAQAGPLAALGLIQGPVPGGGFGPGPFRGGPGFGPLGRRGFRRGPAPQPDVPQQTL